MANLRQFEQQLGDQWPVEAWQDLAVLLAVSGGADSVALFRAIARLKAGGLGRVFVAHLNHGLRGETSDADAEFVADLCQQWDVPCYTGHANVRSLKSEQGDGLEQAARFARYEFLESTAQQCGARLVVTAHTADDQIETILHRIIRGTGLAGLTGIPRVRPLAAGVTLIRPMLQFRRADVVKYLAEIGQPYRHDASNDCLDLTRNRIRHQLLPLLAEQFNSAVADAVLRLGGIADEANQVIQRLVDDLHRDCLVGATATTVQLNCERLRDADAFLVRELFMRLWRERGWPLQAMGFEQWKKLSCGAQQEAPFKQSLPGGVLAEKKDGRLTLARL